MSMIIGGVARGSLVSLEIIVRIVKLIVEPSLFQFVSGGKTSIATMTPR